MSNRLVAGILLAVVAVLGVLTTLSLHPTAPKAADAAQGEFSAQRAIDRLGPVAAEPHPAGSPANAKVRDYLLGELRALGLAPTTDTRVAARHRGGRNITAGTVTDIHVRIPGSAPTGRVLLAAHYDSVAGGPGAADDGANVVSILEIVRALRTGPPLRNDLEILITDGEEAGLLGAKAYVDGGAVRDPRGTVVVNMEARGTSGPAIMFQTVGANSGLMPAVGAGDALATSVSDDVYKLLPNDTDLTVFDEAGVRGLNFAFVGDSVNYHTPHDDLAHLSHATVQDMGDAALAAVRTLGGADLAAMPDGDDTYFTVLGLFVHYPAGLVIPLALLAFVLFVLAFWYHGMRPGRVARGASTFVLPIAGAVVVGIGTWFVLRLLRPEYALFAAGDNNRPFWYALAMSLLTLVLLVSWYRWQRKRLSPDELTFVALAWLTLLALVTAFLVPGGSYVFTWPVLLGSVAMLAARRWASAESPWSVVAHGVVAVPAVLLALPMVLLLFPLVGISVAVAPLVVMVLFAATLLGILVAAVPRRWLTTALAVATVGAFVSIGTGLSVDHYTQQYPRPVSLGYGVDGDTGKAYWISAGDADEDVTASLLRRQIALPAFPVLGGKEVIGAAARPTSDVAVPQVEIMNTTQHTDGTRSVLIRVRAGETAHHVSVFATGAEVVSGTVNGAVLPGGVTANGAWGMTYAAPPPNGVVLTLVVRGGPLTANVTALYRGLPEDVDEPYMPASASYVQYSPLAGQSFAQHTLRL